MVSNDSILRIVEFMEVSAITAPKAKGKDFVKTAVVSGKELEDLADEMIEFGEKTGKKDFCRDGLNVKNSDAVLLLSLREAKPAGLNCGACGVSQCGQLNKVEGVEFDGPLCAWRLIDLGIALGSAVKTASLFNVDNRIMYRIGVAARKIGRMSDDIVVGIPVSVSAKNIYFDR